MQGALRHAMIGRIDQAETCIIHQSSEAAAFRKRPKLSSKPLEYATRRSHLTRFTVQRWMVAVAVLALVLALSRERFGFVFFLMFVGFPVLTTGNRGMALTLRTDSLRAGYCYFAGVVGQAIILDLDPFVVLNPFLYSTIYVSVRPFGYTFFGLEMALLTLWLWTGKDLSPLSGLIAGALRVGAVLAVFVGVVLLSFNVPGFAMLMRVLGFFQLLAAYAYYLQGGLAASLISQKLMTRHTVAVQIARQHSRSSPRYWFR